jgi:hypothetical protein
MAGRRPWRAIKLLVVIMMEDVVGGKLIDAMKMMCLAVYLRFHLVTHNINRYD